MLLNAYSVYDTKALNYSPPFYAPTNGAATRMIADAAADPNNNLGRHPADFVLFRVGTFDDQVGLLEAVQPREHVVDVASLVGEKAPMPPLLAAIAGGKE